MSLVRITAALCALLAAGAVRASASDSPVFGHDPARSGNAAGESALTVSSVHNLHRLWFVQLDAPSESAPVVASGNVFVTTREGTTYAVDTRTGSVRWKFVTHGPGITTAM